MNRKLLPLYWFSLCLLSIASALSDGFEIDRVEFTVPVQTRGHGDQFPWTQLANGNHVTVVNDGRGPHAEILNNTSRDNSDIWQDFGNTYNFKPWLVTDMDLSDLNDPRWKTQEIGFYHMGPFEKRPGMIGGVRSFYSFGALALGNETLIVPITLTGKRHSSGDYRGASVTGTSYLWGGSAFIVTRDGGKRWKLRDGSLLHEFDWNNQPLTPELCTFIPANLDGLGDKSPFTMLVLMQMGAGYRDNEDGFVYAYAPNGHINEWVTEDPTQRQTVLARCYIGRSHENPEAVFDPLNWQVWAGSSWSDDFTQRSPVMTWPSKGTSHGQAWYPSVIYLPSQKVYLAVASSIQPPNYPDTASLLYVYASETPEGPWTQVYASGNFYLQGEKTDRIFSPYWIPGWSDLEAGKDTKGNLWIDCYLSMAGLGDTRNEGWNQSTKKRYGVNVGKFRFTFRNGK